MEASLSAMATSIAALAVTGAACLIGALAARTIRAQCGQRNNSDSNSSHLKRPLPPSQCAAAPPRKRLKSLSQKGRQPHTDDHDDDSMGANGMDDGMVAEEREADRHRRNHTTSQSQIISAALQLSHHHHQAMSPAHPHPPPFAALMLPVHHHHAPLTQHPHPHPHPHADIRPLTTDNSMMIQRGGDDASSSAIGPPDDSVSQRGAAEHTERPTEGQGEGGGGLEMVSYERRAPRLEINMNEEQLMSAVASYLSERFPEQTPQSILASFGVLCKCVEIERGHLVLAYILFQHTNDDTIRRFSVDVWLSTVFAFVHQLSQRGNSQLDAMSSIMQIVKKMKVPVSQVTSCFDLFTSRFANKRNIWHLLETEGNAAVKSLASRTLRRSARVREMESSKSSNNNKHTPAARTRQPTSKKDKKESEGTLWLPQAQSDAGGSRSLSVQRAKSSKRRDGARG
ncbi:unnamed protein product [Vitrella brassicaformis CCMP3155]|uniref:Uncharacterized protein n=1 Tax=Vitrella brassicaformis (strain CCMP3155) TaxID=1169540 RepID=A0A0G4EB80_VITBC|nr:unnamed protein product [Vitrella brassicaformis CCMP3155]|eukprot:CEL92510.1 unnamed protein product [Vitrella brassicaformis CCMP3155]